jgi:hypothetical protein
MQYLDPPSMKSIKHNTTIGVVRNPYTVMEVKRTTLLILPTIKVELTRGVVSNPCLESMDDVTRPFRERSERVFSRTG